MNSTLAYIFLMINIIFTISSSNAALTLELIHRDSPKSPLFQTNLSNLQSYLREIKTSKTNLNKTIFEFPLSPTSSIFTINLPVGNPETTTALVFDITSKLTWMQCKPCYSCFKQNLPIFDPIKSQTFRLMNRTHTTLQSDRFSCDDYDCTYGVGSRSGLSSSGKVSIDKFKYLPKDLVFGCGTFNSPAFYPTLTGVTGVLGMGNVNTSFIRQLADHGDAAARFSYCLSSSSRRRSSILKIGGADDLISNERHNVQTTKFLEGKSLQGGGYRLKLIGISVAGKRLDNPNKYEYSGCIVDTASPISELDDWAYRNVKDAISAYFARFKNVERFKHEKHFYKLCFKYPRGFSDFPGMVWHFEGGANLEVNGTNLFLFGNDLFGSRFVCLQLWGNSFTNVLGVYQQRNVRFLFDLDNEKLSFVQKSC